MVAALYSRLTATADRLLTTYAQGTVQSITYTETGGGEFNPPTVTPVPVTCRAVVSGVNKSYVDGTQIVMSDLMVTMLPITVQPVVGGVMGIDGEDLTVKSVEQVPAAGDPIVLKVIVG